MSKQEPKYLFVCLIIFILLITDFVIAQELKSIELSSLRGIRVESFNKTFKPLSELPLVSFQIGEKQYNTVQTVEIYRKQIIQGIIEIEYAPQDYAFGIKAYLTFRNISEDTVLLHNIVPFGQSHNRVYITGKGDNGLSRTHLFRPGVEPINVIVPDNAWELGFSTVELNNNKKVCALVRRSLNLAPAIILSGCSNICSSLNQNINAL